MTLLVEKLRELMDSPEALIEAGDDLFSNNGSRTGDNPIHLLDHALFNYQNGVNTLPRALMFLRLAVQQGIAVSTPGALVRWEEYDFHTGALLSDTDCDFGDELVALKATRSAADMLPIFQKMDKMLKQAFPENCLHSRGRLA